MFGEGGEREVNDEFGKFSFIKLILRYKAGNTLGVWCDHVDVMFTSCQQHYTKLTMSSSYECLG